MIFVDNQGITDARVNLALEEYVFRNKPTEDDALLFYINAPSIIIGRNQNTIEEINPDAVEANGVTVVRRVSGGGAVYHDLGNLNFSVMTSRVADHFNRYDHFTRPVIDVLRELGVPAELGGRNDILVEGRKISGNAQFASGGRMLSHGTVLVDADLDAVSLSLRPKPGKVESKGVKSVRSRVANISEYLAVPITAAELRERVIERIYGTRDRTLIPSVTITDDDWAGVHALRDAKYGNWSWNFGENPACDIQRAVRYPAGEIDARMNVRDGRISAIRIYGDFMGRLEVAALEARLRGLPYERPAITAALADVSVRDYFGDVTHEDVLNVLCP